MRQFNFIRVVASGEIVGQGAIVADEWKGSPDGSAMQDYQVPEPLDDPAEYWWQSGQAVRIGPAPTQFHKYNPATSQWEDSRSLQDFKDAQWALIKQTREAEKYVPFTWDGSVFDGDQEAIDNIRTALNAATVMPGATVDWTLHDNTVRTLTAEELQAAELTRAQRVGQIFDTARALRAQIDAAGSPEDVQAVVWPG